MSARWSGVGLLLTMVFIQPVYAGDRQGTLDNGLSYIVRQTSRPVGEAEFRLVVKAGELDVTSEKSQGAMHLIEHMAFRNTKDYPDGSLVPFLRGKGFRFGLHLNGATSPGATTYQLSLSHAKPQDLDDGLNVLFNMAQNVDFGSAAFAREKNVVAEEIRMRGDNPWGAVWENGQKLLLSDTGTGSWSYGNADSIKAMDDKDVSALYQTLYSAERMTVIITGNIDTAAAEEALKKKFAAVRNTRATPWQRGPWPVPSGLFYVVNPLPDKSSNFISLSLAVPRSDFKASAGNIQSYQYSLLLYILKQRFGGWMNMDWQFRADGQPVLNWVFESQPDLIKYKDKRPDHFTVLKDFENRLATLIAKPLDQETLDLFKQQYLGSVQQWYATSRNQARTEAELLQNAAQGQHPLIDTAGEWPLVQQAVAGVDSQKISDMLSGMAKGPRYIQVTQERSYLDHLPTRDQLVNWYRDHKPEIGSAASADIRPMPLPAPKEPAGSISSEQQQGELQAFTLSNGMKVFLRTMAQANQLIAFRMDAAGGRYQFGPDLYGAALAADKEMKGAIVAMIPVAELERTRLSKGIIFWPYVDADTHGLAGFSPLAGLDGAFAEIHHRFFRNEKTDFTSASYSYAKADDKFENYQGLVGKLMHPAAFNDDYRVKLLDPQWGQAVMNYHRNLVYRQLWGDPAQFTLMVAGPVQARELKPLLEKWLANIPKRSDSQPVVLAPFTPRAGGEQQVTDPALKVAQDLIEFNSVQASPGSGIAAHALILQAVLEERLRKALRETGGDSYAPWAYITLSPGPSHLARVSIGFDIEPGSEVKALQDAKEIARALRETPVSQQELQNARQIVLRELASEQHEPETLVWRLFWLNQAGMPLDGGVKLRKQVEECSPADLQSAAQSLLATGQMTVGRLTPNPRM